MIALRSLGAGPRKMSELSQALFCDNSNFTRDAWTAHRGARASAIREAAKGDRPRQLLV